MAPRVPRPQVRVGRTRAGPPRLPVALTGTPGTGKSTVARALARRHSVVEVPELGVPRRHRSRSVVVDLDRRRREAWPPGLEIVVGHLSHLLRVRDAIVLRCRPDELARRLARARRGTARDRRQNVEAEATDVVLIEALRAGLRVWEIDTTGRSPTSVARSVARRLRRGGPASYGTVDWLADHRVTEHLLDRPT